MRSQLSTINFKNIKILTMFVSVFVFSACHTLEKEGDEHFENGDYLLSVKSYEKALEKRPKDTDLQSKLQKARSKTIDKQLIDVKQLRFANNWEEGTNQLITVLTEEENWKISPSGAAAFSQDVEMKEFRKYQTKRLRSLLASGTPFAAYKGQKEVQKILAGTSDQKELEVEIQKSGEEFCERKYASLHAQSIYLANLLLEHCSTKFNKSDARAKKISSEIAKDLYSGVSVTNSVASNIRNSSVLSEAVAIVFSGTAWYHVDAKQQASVSLNGDIQANHSKWTENHVETYEESVPYTDYEDRETTVSSNCYSVSTICKPSIQKTVQRVPVTKYRKQLKYRPYTLYQHTVEFKTDLHGSLQLAGLNTGFDINHRHSETTSADSRRLQNQFIDVETSDESYFQSQGLEMAKSLKSRFVDAWSNKYCGQLSGNNTQQTLDLAARCLRGADSKQANQIIFNEFGIEI